MAEISENLAAVRDEVGAACRVAGRSSDDVELVAVSKRMPLEALRVAFEAGQRVFGESRVQEVLAKQPEMPGGQGGARWHFIGHLQKNKIRRVLAGIDLFHGLDSLELAESMDRIADDEGLFPRVLIEVNVAGEASKHGFSPDGLLRDLDALLGLKRLQVEGLMTLAPYAEEAEASRPFFQRLRDLRDAVATRAGLPFSTLSMGMSGDYVVAIQEGATIVRVGTAIFGEREVEE